MGAQAGIHLDMPTAEYFADPAEQPSLSQSMAKVLLERSPAHAYCLHPRLGGADEEQDDEPEKYYRAKAIGNAAHKLLIGRGREVAVGEFHDWRSGEARLFRDGAIAGDLIWILRKDFECAEEMVEAASVQIKRSGRPDAFTRGRGEVAILWEENGIWFRSLIDWLHDDKRAVDDYKTTSLSAAPHMVNKVMADADWGLQAAFQERGLDVLDHGGRGRRKFRFICQENRRPFALTVAELPESVIDMGRRRLRVAVEIWRRCIQSGDWPAYPAEVCFPSIPAYAENRWLDREASEFVEFFG